MDPVVTVLVPAFNRADMMGDLIKSYLAQDFRESELLVMDDCVEDKTVGVIVKSYSDNDSRILLHKNQVNLGFAGNLRTGLSKARGKYIVILGDDDVFATPFALGKYVRYFETYSDLVFVYSNVLECDESLNVDYGFRHSNAPVLFEPGLESLEHAWLLSCYIPGIGLRNIPGLLNSFPSAACLFPQVEFIGKLLLNGSALLTGEFLFAGRAHSQQLGFRFAKERAVRPDERHSVEELPVIARAVAKVAIQNHGMEIGKELIDVVNRFFRESHATILPTEKINCGNYRICKTFAQAIRNDRATLLDLRFLSYFLISLIVPKRILQSIKEFQKKRIVRKKLTMDDSHFIDRHLNFDL